MQCQSIIAPAKAGAPMRLVAWLMAILPRLPVTMNLAGNQRHA
jgi:hypothetical protein